MKRFLPPCFVFLLLILSLSVSAQKKTATVSGKVIDENENPIAAVSVTVLGRIGEGVATTDSGYFEIEVTANRAIALVFSHSGYKTQQKNFLLNENEKLQIITLFFFV